LAQDASDEEWNIHRRAAVETAVRELVVMPERWNDAIRVTQLYLSSDWRDSHPRADASTSKKSHEGDLHPVPVGLGRFLLEGLVSGASSAARIKFFGSISDWNVYHAIRDILPNLDIGEDEILALLVRAVEFGQRDIVLGEILHAASGWARSHPLAARRLVEGALAARPDGLRLPAQAVQVVIEGVVAASEDIEWREKVIDRIAERRTDDAWRLAIAIEFTAWPDAQRSDVHRRHDSLIRRTEEYSRAVIPTAIRCVQYDAADYPRIALETAVRLYLLLPRDMDPSVVVDSARSMSEVASRAIDGLKAHADSEAPVLAVLNYLDLIPPGGNLTALDSVLEDLVDSAPEVVRDFLTRWMLRHASSIRKEQDGFEDWFPLLVRRARGPVAVWSVEWMVAPDSSLREVAANLVSRFERSLFPEAAIHGLSVAQLSALAHVLAIGHPFSGEQWVRALVRVSSLRPETLQLVVSLLCVDAADQYPGTLVTAINDWEDAEPWAAAKASVLDVLRARDSARDARASIAEMLIVPARSTWVERQQAMVDVAMKQAQARSAFAQIVTNVPIARGEASSWSGDPDEAVPFAHYEESGELPLLDVVDPVAAEVRRIEHRLEIDRLLSSNQASDAQSS
jgi:hypothetical protein